MQEILSQLSSQSFISSPAICPRCGGFAHSYRTYFLSISALIIDSPCCDGFFFSLDNNHSHTFLSYHSIDLVLDSSDVKSI